MVCFVLVVMFVIGFVFFWNFVDCGCGIVVFVVVFEYICIDICGENFLFLVWIVF